eukprot:SM000092S24539  [mRNA]  locus=s92:406199:406500:- [translate_table: standard]
MATGPTSAHVRGTDWPPESEPPCAAPLLPLRRSRRIAARDEQRRELKFLEEVRRPLSPSEQSPAEPEPWLCLGGCLAALESIGRLRKVAARAL